MSAFLQTFNLSATDRADAPTIAIKDSIDIAGYATTAASRALANLEDIATNVTAAVVRSKSSG